MRSRHQTEVTLYIVQPPQPFSLCVQPDDGLLEAEHVVVSSYHRLLYNIVVF